MKKTGKKHTNFLISFVFIFQRRKTNDKPDEHKFSYYDLKHKYMQNL